MPAEYFNPNNVAEFEAGLRRDGYGLDHIHTAARDLADPTPELISQYLRFYTTHLTYDETMALYYAFTDVTSAEAGFFEDTDPDMQRGLVNLGILLDDASGEFNYDSGRVRDDFDPDELAGITYDSIRLRHAESELEGLTAAVNTETDYNKRASAALKLKARILAFISEFEIDFKESIESDSPGWKDMTDDFRWRADIVIKNSRQRREISSYAFKNAIQVAHAAITRKVFERKLSQLPQIDNERFDELRLMYGAKGANLSMFNEVIGQVNRLWGRYETKAEIPEFKLMPVEVYDAWVRGDDIHELLTPYYDWVSKLSPDEYGDKEGEPVDYMVRSSAVHSEDGDERTGAGIYESVHLAGGSSFDDFRQAVISVFKSVDSPQAREYRASAGISDEQMGIVLQRYIATEWRSITGHINSRAAGIPQLVEIVSNYGRNFVVRDKLDEVLALDDHGHEDAFYESHHYKPDGHKVSANRIISLAQVTAVLERVWGRPIQLEYVEGLGTQLVQVRPLPRRWQSEVSQVEFPEEDPDHSGSAIGVGDMTLDVLDHRDINTERDGVVIFSRNEMFSMSGGWRGLPRNGAAIVLYPMGAYGHIETLCSEKGLICIYPGSEQRAGNALYEKESDDVRRMRVVANGIEGRVYFIEDN